MTTTAHRLARIDAELAVIKWMVGFNLAATVGIPMMLLRH